MPELLVTATRSEENLCPLCKEQTAGAAEPTRACGGCGVVYHAACLRELGGCATLGCRETKRASPALRAPRPARPVGLALPLVLLGLAGLLLPLFVILGAHSTTRDPSPARSPARPPPPADFKADTFPRMRALLHRDRALEVLAYGLRRTLARGLYDVDPYRLGDDGANPPSYSSSLYELRMRRDEITVNEDYSWADMRRDLRQRVLAEPGPGTDPIHGPDLDRILNLLFEDTGLPPLEISAPSPRQPR